jgi:hypothetical protein
MVALPAECRGFEFLFEGFAIRKIPGYGYRISLAWDKDILHGE